MSSSGFVHMLESAIRHPGLSAQLTRPAQGGTIDGGSSSPGELERILCRIHGHNLVAASGDLSDDALGCEVELAIRMLDAAIGRTAAGAVSLGRLVAEYSSRYIDLQYAIRQGLWISDMPRLNDLLTDLLKTKRALLRAVDHGREAGESESCGSHANGCGAGDLPRNSASYHSYDMWL
jgi:hypothetical protein